MYIVGRSETLYFNSLSLSLSLPLHYFFFLQQQIKHHPYRVRILKNKLVVKRDMLVSGFFQFLLVAQLVFLVRRLSLCIIFHIINF